MKLFRFLLCASVFLGNPMIRGSLASSRIRGMTSPLGDQERHERSLKKVGPFGGNIVDNSVLEDSFEDCTECSEEGANQPSVETELDFITNCRLWFLSDKPTFISQLDYTGFLAEACDALDDEDLPLFDCPDPSFESLGLGVQLLFVWNICDKTDRFDQMHCLNSLTSSQDEFGYDASKTNVNWISSLVDGLCCGLIQFLSLAKLEPDIGLECQSSTVDITAGVLTPSPSGTPHSGAAPFATTPPVHYVSTRSPTNKPSIHGSTASPSIRYGKATDHPSFGTDSKPSPNPMDTGSSGPGLAPSSSNPTDENDPWVNNQEEENRPQQGPLILSDLNGNKVHAATITALTLGASVLFIMGMVSSRRFFCPDHSHEAEEDSS